MPRVRPMMSDDALADDLLASAGLIDKAIEPPSYDEVVQQLRIMDDHDNIIPFIPKRAQRHFMEHRTGRDLILKSRQQGFSTQIQADMFARVVSETLRCATLAHDDATTQKLRRMAERFYDNLPADLRPPRGLDNATTTTYPRTQSEVTIATAGAQNAGRGGTYNYVHGSEVAFWRNAKKILSGLMQGVPKEGQIVLESTPNGAQGWFYEQCKAALEGKGIWTLHFYAWWWDEKYQIALDEGEHLVYTKEEQALVTKHNLTPEQIKWRRAKVDELGDLFPQEYPEDPWSCFLTTGKSAFGDFYPALYLPHTDLDWNPLHTYVAGVDWGQDDDWTVCSIMDANSLHEVSLERWRHMTFKAMRAEIVKLCRKWHVSLIIPERNSAASNVEDLADDLVAAGLSTVVQAIPMSNPFKSLLVSDFKNGIETSDLQLLDIEEARSELAAFVSGRSPSGLYTYEAQPGNHDDTVIARLLAYHAILTRAEHMPPVIRQMKVKGR